MPHTVVRCDSKGKDKWLLRDDDEEEDDDEDEDNDEDEDEDGDEDEDEPEVLRCYVCGQCQVCSSNRINSLFGKKI